MVYVVYNDINKFINDLYFINNNVTNSFRNKYYIQKIKNKLTYLNNYRKYIFKKYVYTINHKRIAINYLYFSMWTGLSGAALATTIRLELAYPGSTFFKGDSLRYLQVITAHGLIMVFFVVVPIYFGFFANFFIPYHVGSKDVAFPRLNSIGF
jgi:heme/copper-type cytochrome/quinol oxidase subunit 1